jgi:hypothetical protein
VSRFNPLPFFVALNIIQLPPSTNLEAIKGSKNIHVYMCLFNMSIHSSLIKTVPYIRVFTKTNDMYTYTRVFVIWMKSPLHKYYELVSVQAELRFCLTTWLPRGLHQCEFCIRSSPPSAPPLATFIQFSNIV